LHETENKSGMTKNVIDVKDHMSDIIRGLEKGILLTTKTEEMVNTMTIAWGQIGIEWNKMIFTAYVRTGRYTHKMLEENPEFTINVPVGEKVGKILGYCGTKSGKDTDKIADCELTLVDSNNVNVPGIKELPLTLECKVIYKQLQVRNDIPQGLRDKFYPEAVGSEASGANGDLHTMFYGEIVGAYMIGE
jgi:flavin reductase (DIM6/NTAB) family NADH-FMN oxidoreductase RutF